MKNLAFSLCLAASLLVSGASLAYETPNKDPQSAKIIDTTAHSVEEYAEQFGMPKLVYAEISKQGQIVKLQYMPEDLADPMQWTRMLDITVYGMAGDPKGDLEAQKKLVLGLEMQFKHGGQVSANDNYMMNEGKDLGMFIQFTMNPGTSEQMQAAGAFLRITDKAAAYIQLNTRVRPLKKKEAVQVHKLVNPLAGQPPPDPRGKR
jgi:hypothetical protein